MNLSVSSITHSGANLVVKGKGASGNTVTIVNGSNTLGTAQVDNNGDWEITFPSAGVTSFTVKSGGKEENIVILLPAVGTEATATTVSKIPIFAQAVA